MATKQGPSVLYCMQNRTKCILLLSVMPAQRGLDSGGDAQMNGDEDELRQHYGYQGELSVVLWFLCARPASGVGRVGEDSAGRFVCLPVCLPPHPSACPPV
jgi:hypothetical protein